MRRIFTQKKTRKQIENEAFVAMRKAKAAIDPGVLAKVRQAIENSPMAGQIMGGLTKKKAKPASQDPSFAKELDKKQKALLAAKQAHKNLPSEEKPLYKEDVTETAQTAPQKEEVDRAKMLDIVAKTLALNPHNSGLKKGVKDILWKD